MTDETTVDERAVALVRRWVDSHGGRGSTTAASRRLAGLLADPDGLEFAIGFVDRVVRPEDPRVAARNLRRLARTTPRFLSTGQRTALRVGSAVSHVAPALVVDRATRVLRRLVGHLVVDATPERLGPAVARLRRRGDRLNLNLLGEAVLGDAEATRRRDATLELLRRDDVDYVSVKVSAVASHLSRWAFDESVDRVVDQLAPLYAAAAQGSPPTFINLDMEEYHDLDLTSAVFTRLLDLHPRLEAGIVLQAYLPDALGALARLQTWARARRATGGAPIKVRIVKGANLAMERVDAEQHGWPLATWGTKAETDASYKRVLDLALRVENVDAVRVGLAGQNLFDIAWAWLLAGDRGVRDAVDVEMLLGMDAGPAEAVRAEVGRLLLYTPVVAPDEFDSAISYLVRRLEENASPENFMSSAFRLAADPAAFDREADRFRASIALLDHDVPSTHRVQDRRTEHLEAPVTSFVNTPDTDPSIAANRAWARSVLGRAEYTRLGAATVREHRVHGPASLETLVRSTRAAATAWQQRDPALRAWLLHQAGNALAARRGDLVSIMVAEADKTLTEADAEVSEAVDFAHYYAESARRLGAVDGARFVPVDLTVVAPPWNFPVAIPAGSILAALAAGSGVVVKPAPQVPRCTAVVVEALWQAGIPADLLRYAGLDEGPLSRDLVAHPRVDRVILTGSWETAALFRSWRHDLQVLAETSGKNAVVVTPNADLDLAVADLVRSAFGHAGQKCSAASLGILVGSVGTSTRFRRQLVDAVASLRVGSTLDPRTEMGPVVEVPTGKLASALTDLAPGEEWLLAPRRLDDARLWTPGIRAGVAPDSEFHRTEYFGPVLGLMHAPDLETAIRWQNATDFGLTAGLHSLDTDEIATWIDQVEAGNLYVNRPTTGAIVQRQPFGGWKRSSVGGSTKAGGPNYLARLGRWEPRPLRPRSTSVSLTDEITAVLNQVMPSFAPADLAWVLGAAESDQIAWEREFGVAKDVTGLASERNVLRYRPVPVTIRADGPVRDLVRVVLAALRVGAPVTVSTLLPPPEGLPVPYVIESHDAWLTRLDRERPERVRLLGSTRSISAAAVDGDPDVAFFDDAVTQSGRIEALPFLREQAVSLTRHRFGNPVHAFDGLLPRGPLT